jgi:hypothetical protein
MFDLALRQIFGIVATRDPRPATIEPSSSIAP